MWLTKCRTFQSNSPGSVIVTISKTKMAESSSWMWSTSNVNHSQSSMQAVCAIDFAQISFWDILLTRINYTQTDIHTQVQSSQSAAALLTIMQLCMCVHVFERYFSTRTKGPIRTKQLQALHAQRALSTAAQGIKRNYSWKHVQRHFSAQVVSIIQNNVRRNYS